MLVTVTKKSEVTKCQKALLECIKRHLTKKEIMTVGFHGGSIENLVHYSNDLWFSGQVIKDVSVPRYWNAFGLTISPNKSQSIVVEINPQLDGKSRSVAGLFAKDEASGEYYILHRGNLGGSKKGIGKRAFREWYRGSWESVACDGKFEEALMLGALSSSNLVEKIRLFAIEVDTFKKEISTGKNSRKPPKSNPAIEFNPEFSGRKRGYKNEIYSYDSNHGLVVDELVKHLKTGMKGSRKRVFNNQYIDLGIRTEKAIKELFEVKTSTDRQSIYTGVGQLMFHSGGDASVRKTLVLPEGNKAPKDLGIRMSSIGVSILYFSIIKGKVKFTA
ncbi:MAG: hypothetical protein ACI8YQ_004985 [Polaribacter sp.]|jgi:hypothetical protein